MRAVREGGWETVQRPCPTCPEGDKTEAARGRRTDEHVVRGVREGGEVREVVINSEYNPWFLATRLVGIR